MKQVIELTNQLIAIESIQDKPERLREIIELISSFWGDEKSSSIMEHNRKPSLILHLTPDTPTQLLLHGHADVVPGEQSQFIPKIIGDKLYGRGAQDMKSGLAGLICLIKELKQDKIKSPISLLVVTDEEIGGFDGAKNYLESLRTKPKFFLSGEPTDLAIEYEAKGIIWVKLVASGKIAHSAYPWEGENAIVKLCEEVSNLKRTFPDYTDWTWATTCNPGKIAGGLATNQVCGSAEITLDIRRIPSEDTEFIISQIKANLVHPDTQVEVLLDEPSHHSDTNNLYVKKLASSIETVTKSPTQYIQKCGASDARHASYLDIPSVCFGPTGAGLHTDKEWVDLVSLETYYQILKNFTLDFFGPVK